MTFVCLYCAQIRQLPSKSGSGTTMRHKAEGKDKCQRSPGPAANPPPGSMEPWVKAWTADEDVLRSKHPSNRRYGRCNHEFNVCVTVDATGTATHLASTHGTNELRASNCSAKTPTTPGASPEAPQHAKAVPSPTKLSAPPRERTKS